MSNPTPQSGAPSVQGKPDRDATPASHPLGTVSSGPSAPHLAAPADCTYSGFISYSHKDAKAVIQAMRHLERFSLPRSLIGQETEEGKTKKRIRPLFRDRDEFSSNHSLSEAIQTALQDSPFLLVFCSPSAAQSAYVNEEIRVFARLRGRQRIITIIIDGDPSQPVGPGMEGCLPPALMDDGAEEPLGIDLRASGDGFKMGTLKIIASLHGLEFSRLLNRDQVRKRQTVIGITVLGSILCLTFAGLAYSAFQGQAAARTAEREAVKQRTEAEALIEFMLVDFQEKLAPVARRDILLSVGEKALNYYKSQNLDTLSAESLAQRAQALHVLGRVADMNGKLDDMARYVTAAYATTSQLLTLTPDNLDLIYAQAQSAFWLGQAAKKNKNIEEWEAYYIEYDKLASRMIELKPDDVKYLLEKAYSTNNLASLYSSRTYDGKDWHHDRKATQDYLDAWTPIGNKLAKLAPKNRTVIKNAISHYTYRGRAAANIHDLAAAEAAYAAAIARLDAFDPDRKDYDMNNKRAIIYRNWALALSWQNRPEKSRKMRIKRALPLMKRHAFDPENQLTLNVLLANANALAGDNILLSKESGKDTAKDTEIANELINQARQLGCTEQSFKIATDRIVQQRKKTCETIERRLRMQDFIDNFPAPPSDADLAEMQQRHGYFINAEPTNRETLFCTLKLVMAYISLDRAKEAADLIVKLRDVQETARWGSYEQALKLVYITAEEYNPDQHAMLVGHLKNNGFELNVTAH